MNEEEEEEEKEEEDDDDDGDEDDLGVDVVDGRPFAYTFNASSST